MVPELIMFGFCFHLGLAPALCIMLCASAAVAGVHLGLLAGILNLACWFTLLFFMFGGPGIGLSGPLRFAPIYMACLNAIVAFVLWRNLPVIYPSGQCQSCGYPLRDLLGGQCPECGRTFDPEQVSPSNGSPS
jgi:hypothetical protein